MSARRLAGAGLWRRGGARIVEASGPGYLLDYSQATFTRASEAAFYDPRTPAFVEATEAANWPLSNVPRIFSDGAILVEGARTNLVTYSADYTNAAWVSGGTPTVAASGTPAPDGGTAYEITDDQAGAVEFKEITATVTATGTHTVSCFVLKDAVTSRFPALRVAAATASMTHSVYELHINTSTGATASAGGVPGNVRVEDAGAWWRVSYTVNVTATGTVVVDLMPARAVSIGTSSVTATGTTTFWGVQLEAGGYPSTPIRTSGATATRATEACRFLAGEWNWAGGPIVIDFWPSWSSAEGSGLRTVYQVEGSPALTLTFNGSTLQYYGGTIGTLQSQIAGATWSAGQKLTITLDPSQPLLRLEGATSGNGETTTGAATAIDSAAQALRIGSGTAANREGQGVFSRPYNA